MKISKTLLIIFFLLCSTSVFSQHGKDIVSYSYIKDAKGRVQVNRFAGNFGTDFLGSDDRYTYLYSARSTMTGAKKIYLYACDKNTLKMNKPYQLKPDKTIKGTELQDVLFFKKKLYVFFAVNDNKKEQTSYYIQELDGGTFQYKNAPVKLYEGGMRLAYSDLGYKGTMGYHFPYFAEYDNVVSDDNDKMLFLFMPLRRKESIQKIYTVLVDENMGVSAKNEYSLSNTAGKITSFANALMNGEGHAFLTATYKDQVSSAKTNYKFLVLDLLSPGEFHEGNMENKKFTLEPLKVFVVDDSLVYNVSTASIVEVNKNGFTTSSTEEGLYLGIYSLSTGDNISETMINLEHNDFEDLKGKIKSAERTGKLSVDQYFTYNKFTEKMYVIYEAVTEEQRGNYIYRAGGNLKIKEFNRSLEQTSSYTFSRVKGEGGVIPVCTPEGTYFITDTREKNEDYENESDFKVSGGKPGYYVLKIKDDHLSAYGYSIKQPFNGAWTDLHHRFLSLNDNEKLFYSTALTKGDFSFVKIKFL